MKPSLRLKFLIAIIALAMGGLAIAQEEPAADPPGRVARLQFVQGETSLQPGGVDDWVPADLNRPLTTADRIWTDVGARAELTTGSAALRMNGETSLAISNLNDNTTQIELDQGSLNIFVRQMEPGEVVEIDTPNLAYTVLSPGEYHFDVMPDADQSVITVRRGYGQATGDGNPVDVVAGQRFQFSGGQSLSYAALPFGEDSFDNWCRMRENQQVASPSARYVAPGTIGYEDLDANGYWEPTAFYGPVWFPNVHPGWAPYREGHWAWIEPWGWTWVDDAPWGFAPFHYGRWVNVNSRWGWVPGPAGIRPVYAPALVAWVGGAPGGVGVAWVPLGWHDPFIPGYHVSVGYARAVNLSNSRVVNVTVVNNYYATTDVHVRETIIVNNIHYENVRVTGAVVGVPADAFSAGRPVGRVAVVVPAGRVKFVAAAAIVPTHAAVLGGRRPIVIPARIVTPRQIVARTAPPVRPLSFEQQRPLLERSAGMPLSPAARATLRASAPAPRPGMGARPAVVIPSRAATAPAHPGGLATSSPYRPGASAPGHPGFSAGPTARPAVPRPPSATAPAANREAVPGRPSAPAPANANRPANTTAPVNARPGYGQAPANAGRPASAQGRPGAPAYQGKNPPKPANNKRDERDKDAR